MWFQYSYMLNNLAKDFVYYDYNVSPSVGTVKMRSEFIICWASDLWSRLWIRPCVSSQQRAPQSTCWQSSTPSWAGRDCETAWRTSWRPPSLLTSAVLFSL